MSNAVHVLAAVQQVHEHAKYYPMTAKDKTTAEEAGLFAGVVVVVLAVIRKLSGGGRKPATSR